MLNSDTAKSVSQVTENPLLKDIRLVFRSGDFAVRRALASVLSGLRFLELSEEETGTVELVLAEVLNNIVEHAYDADTPGQIELICAHRPDGLHFKIIDSGQTLQNGELPQGLAATLEGPLQELPEGGFGWFLIRELAHDVAYSCNGGKNTLTLRLAVGLPMAKGQKPGWGSEQKF